MTAMLLGDVVWISRHAVEQIVSYLRLQGVGQKHGCGMPIAGSHDQVQHSNSGCDVARSSCRTLFDRNEHRHVHDSHSSRSAPVVGVHSSDPPEQESRSWVALKAIFLFWSFDLPRFNLAVLVVNSDPRRGTYYFFSLDDSGSPGSFRFANNNAGYYINERARRLDSHFCADCYYDLPVTQSHTIKTEMVRFKVHSA
jgi:hypothetical protein